MVSLSCWTLNLPLLLPRTRRPTVVQVEKSRRKEAAREALLAEEASRAVLLAEQRRRLQQVA